MKRGLFRTAHDWYLHADAQAAANIIRKVNTTLGLDLSEVCRGRFDSFPENSPLVSSEDAKPLYFSQLRSIRLESPPI